MDDGVRMRGSVGDVRWLEENVRKEEEVNDSARFRFVTDN
jgi:hypothetical protein